MKTAISVDDELMGKADAEAAKAGVSRSKFFSMAMEAYLKKLEDDHLLEALNQAYDDDQAEEIAFAEAAKRHMAKIVDPW